MELPVDAAPRSGTGGAIPTPSTLSLDGDGFPLAAASDSTLSWTTLAKPSSTSSRKPKSSAGGFWNDANFLGALLSLQHGLDRLQF